MRHTRLLSWTSLQRTSSARRHLETYRQTSPTTITISLWLFVSLSSLRYVLALRYLPTISVRRASAMPTRHSTLYIYNTQGTPLPCATLSSFPIYAPLLSRTLVTITPPHPVQYRFRVVLRSLFYHPSSFIYMRSAIFFVRHSRLVVLCSPISSEPRSDNSRQYAGLVLSSYLVVS